LLKEKITKQRILIFPYFSKPFQVKYDASGVTIDAILSQDHKHVAYFSENLNDAKRKYWTYDKEFYATIQYLKKWRHYLRPKEFIFYIDNHALQFIMRQEKLNQRHTKCIKFMHNIFFVIKHISGSANKVVYDLRRSCFIFQEFQVETLGFGNLKKMYKEDSNFQEAYESCENHFMRDRISWMDYMM
jgi:hypothetical protein